MTVPTQDEIAEQRERDTLAIVVRALEVLRELASAAASNSSCPAYGREFDRLVTALKAKL